MPAVVRVKRRIDEEPLNAFVLNGKKRRLVEGAEGSATPSGAVASGKQEISTVLKFAGTLKEQDNKATSQFVRLRKGEAKQLVQEKTRKSVNTTDRLRQEARQNTHENRFHVVNCLRTVIDDEEERASSTTDKAKEVTIVDIEKHAATSNDKRLETDEAAAASAMDAEMAQQPADSDIGYVYDLYLPENEQQAENVDLMDDNYLSAHALDDLVYEETYSEECHNDYESDDSNCENHCGNDYPDEDEFSDGYDHDDDADDDDKCDMRQLRKAMKKFVFDDDEEDTEAAACSNSSEDEDCNPYQDPYVHTQEIEDGFFDVDEADVERYGMGYALYKRRIFKKLTEPLACNRALAQPGGDKPSTSESPSCSKK